MHLPHKRIFALLLLSVLCVSIFAAPLKDNSKLNDKDDQGTDQDGDRPTLLQPGDNEQEHVQQNLENDETAADTETDEDVPEEGDDDRGQEVINYQDIQVDHDSKVTSENEAEKQDDESDEEETDTAEETEEEEGEGEEEEEDEVEDEGGDGFEYVLTPSAARELLLELRDPVQVAKFVVETDDSEGFLRALRLLLHDGYISEAQAYSLKEAVAAQLRNLLMLQKVELSRALFDNYQPQMEEDRPAAAFGMNPEMYNQQPQAEEYYDYANLLNEGDAYGSSQINLYDAYQEAIEEESSQALAEIAGILAQRIAKGEISPEEGAKIMSKVVQLLPDSYWGGSESEMMGSESLASDYGMQPPQQSVSSETSDMPLEEEEDEDEEEDDQEPDVEENFEEELMEVGPNGLVKEIKETDQNGQDDAAELTEEADDLALELQQEVDDQGLPAEGKAMKIERPGAEAVVKIEPSNDVIDDDIIQDWKDMSLLLDKNIPESVLRSLGVTFNLPKQQQTTEEKLEKELEGKQ